MSDPTHDPERLGEDVPVREHGEPGEGLEAGGPTQPLLKPDVATTRPQARAARPESPAVDPQQPAAPETTKPASVLPPPREKQRIRARATVAGSGAPTGGTEALPVQASQAPTTQSLPVQRPQAPSTQVFEAPGAEADDADVMDELGYDEDPGEYPRLSRGSGWGRALGMLALCALLLGGLYLGVAFWAGSVVPAGTTVRGVDIGGATKEDAAQRLRERLAERVNAPVVVAAENRELRVQPSEAGMSVDLDGTLSGLTGMSLDPRIVWQRLTGKGEERRLKVSVDEAKVAAALQAQAGDLRTQASEGSVSFTNGTVQTTDPVPGQELDAQATAALVGQTWPADEAVQAQMRTLDPTISKAELDAFAKDQAGVVVSGPVTLRLGNEKAVLDPAKLGTVAQVERKDDKLSLKFDEAGLLKAVRAAAPKAETPATDATIKIQGGKAALVDEKVGKQIDPESLSKEFTAAATRTSPREATVALKDLPPKLTKKDLAGVDLSAPMAEFRSRFPGGKENEARTHNIRLGLTFLDGKVVKPGEQFSLLKILGPMDESQGYVEAGVIQNGMPAAAVAGGLSQVSTVVYNTSYLAGVKLDAHTPHTYYISRYPAGREATIWAGEIDNQWTNDTPAPILIETHIEGAEVVMRFWGQRVYEVESVSSERTNIKKPEKKNNDAANCEPDHGTEEGFTITVTRVLSKDGKEVRREPVTTTYQPANDVTCTNPQAPGYGH